MSTLPPSLASRHTDLTQSVILDSAIRLLEAGPVTELSVRAVAKQGGMSERTVFRYFATRDEMLDAVALEMSRRLDPPPEPTCIEALPDYPQAIFARFEATEALTKAALHSELYNRIRSTDAGRRGVAIRALLDRAAPDRPEQERKLATANILYHVIATTWHYYRFYYGFSPEETVAAAKLAIVQSLAGLGITIEVVRPREDR